MRKLLGGRLGPCPACGEELTEAQLVKGESEGYPEYGFRTFEPVTEWDELFLSPCRCRLRGERAWAAIAKIREYAKPKEASVNRG